jgi:hypothetical protein
MRVAAMDQRGLAQAPGERQLAAEHLPLHGPRREIPEEVEAHLAERDDARGRGETLQLVEERPVTAFGIVRMEPDRRPDVRITLGQRQRRP